MPPKVLSVNEVFDLFKKQYKKLPLKLASGGLEDVKGVGDSDVDISLLSKDYKDLDEIFKGSTKKVDDKKARAIYSYEKWGREINVYATDDPEIAKRSVRHRENELMLNKFPILVSQAVYFKLNGLKTEPSWAKVLELDGDPYDALLMDKKDLKAIATKKEKYYATLINRLP